MSQAIAIQRGERCRNANYRPGTTARRLAKYPNSTGKNPAVSGGLA